MKELNQILDKKQAELGEYFSCFGKQTRITEFRGDLILPKNQ